MDGFCSKLKLETNCSMIIRIIMVKINEVVFKVKLYSDHFSIRPLDI